jgi:hypothetical protein
MAVDLKTELARTEPEYTRLAGDLGSGGLPEIRTRLDEAAAAPEADRIRELVRATFLCGVFGQVFPGTVQDTTVLLRPQLADSRARVRIGAGAAAVELGRVDEGVSFRDEVLAKLLGDPDVAVRGWVLNAIADNELTPLGPLRQAVVDLANDQNAPEELRELARPLV